MILAIWSIGALISWPFMYAVEFGYWQGRYDMLAEQDYNKDRVFSLGLSALTALIWFPLGWLLVVTQSEFCSYGLKWK